LFPLILRKRASAVSKDGRLAPNKKPILRDGPDGPPQDEEKSNRMRIQLIAEIRGAE